jgi:hypothetical protein
VEAIAKVNKRTLDANDGREGGDFPMSRSYEPLKNSECDSSEFQDLIGLRCILYDTDRLSKASCQTRIAISPLPMAWKADGSLAASWLVVVWQLATVDAHQSCLRFRQGSMY